MRCRRYLNRKKITRAIPPERFRYAKSRIKSHRRPVLGFERDRLTEDNLTNRGITTDENEL
jgi:hypothetical protein